MNKDDEVTGFVLEHAAELLRPYLFPESQVSSRPKAKSINDAANG